MSLSLKDRFFNAAKKMLLNYNEQGYFPDPKQAGLKTKRVAYQLKHQRTYRAEVQMSEWRRAILTAEDPYRPRRMMLLELYKEVLRDFHLLSQVRNRIIKTTGSPYALFAVGGDEPLWDFTRLIETTWFRKYMKYTLESIFYGHSLMEFQQLVEARPTVPGSVEFEDVFLMPRMHVVPERGELLINSWDERGLPYREAPINEWMIEAGEHDDLGLLLPAVREVIWKLYTRGDWSQMSEKFGMPLLALATAGMDEKEIDKMEQMAANFGSNGYVIIDDLDKVKMIESQRSDAFRVYLELCKYADEQNSKGVSGVSSMSEQKAFVGSAEVQERQFNELIEDDMRLLSSHVNEQLLPFLIRHGYPLEGLEFRFIKLENDDEDDSDDEQPKAEKKKLQLKKPYPFT